MTPTLAALRGRTCSVLHDPLASRPAVECGAGRHAGRPVALAATSTATRRAARTPSLAGAVRARRTDATAWSTTSSTTPIVVILPIQNPDGREVDRGGTSRLRHEPRLVRPDPARDRRQARGHPAVPADALHRRPRVRARPTTSSRRTPIPSTHEIPDQANDWINGLYSPAIQRQFDRERHQVSSTARRMTSSRSSSATRSRRSASRGRDDAREGEPATRSACVSTSTSPRCGRRIAAGRRTVAQVMRRLARLVRRGLRAGRRTARSRRTASSSRGTSCYQQVPTDTGPSATSCSTIRGSAYELDLLVRRLQRMDVDVYRLTAPLTLDALPPVRRRAAATTLPGRDVLDPDGTGPEALDPGDAERGLVDPVRRHVRRHGLEQPAPHEPRGRLDRRAVDPAADVVPPSTSRPGHGAADMPVSRPVRDPEQHARLRGRRSRRRYLFDKVWASDRYEDVTAADIIAGPVPGRSTCWSCPTATRTTAVQALGAKGKRALRDWVNAGGRLVAWQGGVGVAAKAGVIDREVRPARTPNVPGTLIRVSLDDVEPARRGRRRPRLGHVPGRHRRCSPASAQAVAIVPRGRPSPTTRRPVSTIGVDTLAGTAARRRRGVSAPDGSSRSRSTRTSAPGRRARSDCRGTPSSGRIRRVLGLAAPAGSKRPRGCGEGGRRRRRSPAAARYRPSGSGSPAQRCGRDRPRSSQRHGAEVVRGRPRWRCALPRGQPRRPVVSRSIRSFALVVRDLQKAGITPRAASLP